MKATTYISRSRKPLYSIMGLLIFVLTAIIFLKKFSTSHPDHPDGVKDMEMPQSSAIFAQILEVISTFSNSTDLGAINGSTEYSTKITPLIGQLSESGRVNLAKELYPFLLNNNATTRLLGARAILLSNTLLGKDMLVQFCLDNLTDRTGLSKETGPGWEMLLDLGSEILPSLIEKYRSLSLKYRLDLVFFSQAVDTSIFEPIVNLALNDSDAKVVSMAIEAKGHLKGGDAYEILTKYLSSGVPNYQCAAVVGLMHLGDPRAIAELLTALDKENFPCHEFSSEDNGQQTFHSISSDAIDKITNRNFSGNKEQIRQWLLH